MGLPGGGGEEVISHPLAALELRDLIYSVHRADISAAVLTMELLCYLAMFIRTEPHLFHGMIRIRVGLIIQAIEKLCSSMFNIILLRLYCILLYIFIFLYSILILFEGDGCRAWENSKNRS